MEIEECSGDQAVLSLLSDGSLPEVEYICVDPTSTAETEKVRELKEGRREREGERGEKYRGRQREYTAGSAVSIVHGSSRKATGIIM